VSAWEERYDALDVFVRPEPDAEPETLTLFCCRSCGAATRYWGSHDGLHQQLNEMREQIEALISTTWTHTDLLDKDGARLDALDEWKKEF
jgi:hypothetical protein